MSSRFFGTILFSLVYRVGKREFKTAAMCASPASHIELQTSEVIISGSLTDSQHQENFEEQSFNTNTINCDTSLQVHNLIDDTPSASDEGTKLSKRALKRVQC